VTHLYSLCLNVDVHNTDWQAPTLGRWRVREDDILSLRHQGHAFSGAPTWTLATELGLSSSSRQHTSRQRSSSVRLLTSTSSLDTWLGWRVRLGGLPHHGWHPIGRGCAKWSWSSIAEGGCSGRHDVHASSPVVEKAQLRHRRRGRAGHGDPLDLSWITT
jgi:hypothetical protein